MPTMTDPMVALISFQQALIDGEVRLRPAELDPELFVFADKPKPGTSRFTYVRLDGRTVKSFVNVINNGLIDGLPCFQLGVAVPEKYRNKGLAKSTLTAAMAELQNGLSRNKIPSFYVEGVVSVDNEPSKRASAATISANPTPVTDEESGLPALHYVRKFG